MVESGRIEFSKPTRDLIAKRSGFRCSFPSCRKLTIGPGVADDEIAQTGRLAHIYSAASGGPRGQGTLTEEELRSPQNAIWLCTEHAALIDTNRGDGFPPSMLLSYKALNEARTARDQNGIDIPFGWIQELVVRESPILAPNSTIRFGKVTVVVGDNASGKTSLCEWLSGIADPSLLGRWLNPDSRLNLDVTYFDPAQKSISLRVSDSGSLSYTLNGSDAPFYPYRLNVVHLREYLISSYYSEEDHRDELEIISDILRVHPSILRNVVPRIDGVNEGSFSKVRLEERPDGWKLFAFHHGDPFETSFRRMSDSQRAKILIELCVAIASFSSEFAPTILAIDGGIKSLDRENFSRYVTYLADPKHHFQSILFLIYPPARNADHGWDGWEPVRLLGRKQNVIVDQTPF